MYSKETIARFRNPENTGEIKNPDAVGEVGNMKCGDVMKIYLKIKDFAATQTFLLIQLKAKQSSDF